MARSEPGALERRLTLAPGLVEARAANDGTSRRIAGYGATFDEWTQIGPSSWGFRERIAPGAFTKTIGEADVRAMFNHDPNYLLGRTSAGTLRLAEDDKGLAYDLDVNPDDPQALSVHAKVARGDVTGSSFWFRVLREEWVDAESTDSGMDERTIFEVELFETGPVSFPAYESTEAEAASAAVDTANSLAGVLGAPRGRRARVAYEILTDPERAEQARQLIDQLPGLRAALIGEPARAADEAPDAGHGTPLPEHLPIERHLAFSRGLAGATGLPEREAHAS